MLDEGSFHLTKWISNHKEVIEAFPVEDHFHRWRADQAFLTLAESEWPVRPDEKVSDEDPKLRCMATYVKMDTLHNSYLELN